MSVDFISSEIAAEERLHLPGGPVPKIGQRRPRGVVIVSPGGLNGSGGIATVTRSMYSWLRSNCDGLRVTVLDPRAEGRYAKPAIRLMRTACELIYVRLRYRPEILHLQVSERSSFTRKGALLLLGRVLGMRVVLHHHGAEFIPTFRATSSFRRSLVRRVIRRAHVNIVLGMLWQDFFVDEIRVPVDRVKVHYNAALDLAANDNQGSPDPWSFLFLANLSERKGVSEALKATALLARSGAPVRITLAGGGDVEKYRAEAEALGIADRCTFTGWVDGTTRDALFFAHSALLLPSHDEGFPMSIIEALSARLPVIATPAGSTAELMRAGETCLFIRPRSVEDIVVAMMRIAEEADLRETLRRNGRALYERDLRFDDYMRTMLTVYGRLLGDVFGDLSADVRR